MIATKKRFVLVALLSGLWISGCASRSGRSEWSPKQAARWAVGQANQEAKRRYNLEPFREENGTLTRQDGRWIWQGLTSSGQVDLTARVSFTLAGKDAKVKIQMLTQPILAPLPRQKEAPALPRSKPIPSREIIKK